MEKVPNTLIEKRLDWRYATKRFDPTLKISDQDWRTLEHALVQSPSSFGLQPCRFIVVENEELRQTLQKHSANQPQIVEASHLVVLAAKTSVTATDVDSFIERVSTARETPEEGLVRHRDAIAKFMARPSFSSEEWSTRQVYLSLGILLSTAALMGIDSCPIEGFEPDAYDRELDLPRSGYAAKVVCALGYRSSSDTYAAAPKVRRAPSDVIHRK